MTQSATYWATYDMYGTQWYLHAVLLVPAAGSTSLPDNVMSSRHTSPNYGDGPWFRARKSSQNIQVKRLDGIVVTGGIPAFGCNSSDSVGWYPMGNQMMMVTTNATACTLSCVTLFARIRNGYCEFRQVTTSYTTTSGEWVVHNSPEQDLEVIKTYSPLLRQTADTGWVIDWYPLMGTFIEPDLSFNFKYREFDTFNEILDLGVYLNRCASGFSAAYTQAAQGIPDADVNLLASVLEIMTAVKGIAKGLKAPVENFTKAIRSLADPRDMWLAYRYSYTTTKLDVNELKEFTKRVLDLKLLADQTVSLYGSFSDGEETFNCTLSLPVAQVLPDAPFALLERAGMDLTVSNVWDLIPYSFVVDWFLGISDLIEWFEDWAESLTLAPGEIWYSYKSAYDGQTVFYRVRGRMINIPPRYMDRNVSSKTIKMRIADTISLFT